MISHLHTYNLISHLHNIILRYHMIMISHLHVNQMFLFSKIAICIEPAVFEQLLEYSIVFTLLFHTYKQ